MQIQELTAMVRAAGRIASQGDRDYVRAQERAEGIEHDMERLAQANGFTVAEVLAAAQDE